MLFRKKRKLTKKEISEFKEFLNNEQELYEYEVMKFFGFKKIKDLYLIEHLDFVGWKEEWCGCTTPKIIYFYEEEKK